MRILNPFTTLVWSLALCGTVILLTSCGKKDATLDASKPLQESFQTAQPETKQAVETVTTHLRQGQYVQAARALEPVINRPMTVQQKQAVGTALQQINQAVAANPALDTREMYEMRARMFKAVHSGPRF